MQKASRSNCLLRTKGRARGCDAAPLNPWLAFTHPPGRKPSERQAANDLAGSWTRSYCWCSGTIASVDPIDISVTAGEPALTIKRCRRDRIRTGQDRKSSGLYGNRTRQEQPIEHILKLRANLELDVPLAAHE